MVYNFYVNWIEPLDKASPLFFNFLDAMQLMCLTVHLFFYNKINEDLSSGGIDVRVGDTIDIIDGYKGGGYGVSAQHELSG